MLALGMAGLVLVYFMDGKPRHELMVLAGSLTMMSVGSFNLAKSSRRRHDA